MASYYMLKPVRESLFLHYQGVKNFPKVHILTVFVTYFAAQFYDLLGRHIAPSRLAIYSAPTFAALIVAFWAVIRSISPESSAFPALVWIYYQAVSLYAVFVVALFWGLTNGAFRPDEGQKHYGIIGAGGILGGAVGGSLTEHLAQQLGSHNLLPLSALLILPCYFLARTLDACRQPSPESPGQQRTSSLRLLFENRYVGAMGLLIMLTLGVEEFGDHQTQRVLEDSHLSRDQITEFYGRLFFYTNLLGCLISLLLTRAIQSRFGPGPGLIGLQLAASAKAIGICIWPTTDCLLWLLSLDLAMHYSLFQSSKELLYIPTSREVKLRAKTLIDTFLFRLGAGGAALVVLLFLVQAEQTTISACLVALALCASGVGYWLHCRYQELTRLPQNKRP